MMEKRIGNRTLRLDAVRILSYASVGGRKEGEGPLGSGFDAIYDDSYCGEKTWELAESHMLQHCFHLACSKASLSPSELDLALSGDLLNQCVSSAFSLKDSFVPYLGLYSACSTMTEALGLGAVLVDGAYARLVCAMTGSHFCTAERQYRFPLEYGGQRTPSSQWTVTGAGAVLLGRAPRGLKITHVTFGRIVDAGITDANSMGSAMAPAAFDTLRSHFSDTGRGPEAYDAIFTGDLGVLGHDILEALFKAQGVELGSRYRDCGALIYDQKTQEVDAGGSGCGCCASVLASHILPGLESGTWRRVLVAATGALLSATSAQQGASIPGICHAVAIERED